MPCLRQQLAMYVYTTAFAVGLVLRYFSTASAFCLVGSRVQVARGGSKTKKRLKASVVQVTIRNRRKKQKTTEINSVHTYEPI